MIGLISLTGPGLMTEINDPWQLLLPDGNIIIVSYHTMNRRTHHNHHHPRSRPHSFAGHMCGET